MTDFNEIYSLYFKDVYRYALVLCRNEPLAEEITQETFYKALKNIESFKGECKMSVWLCQIAKNTYFTHQTKEKKHCSYEEAPEYTYEYEFENEFFKGESAFEILKLIHKLDEPYKEVISLRLFGELSFAKIAELFGKTESWARVTFHRAKAKIREELI